MPLPLPKSNSRILCIQHIPSGNVYYIYWDIEHGRIDISNNRLPRDLTCPLVLCRKCIFYDHCRGITIIRDPSALYNIFLEFLFYVKDGNGNIIKEVGIEEVFIKP